MQGANDSDSEVVADSEGEDVYLKHGKTQTVSIDVSNSTFIVDFLF
jgi:hypothetical protein